MQKQIIKIIEKAMKNLSLKEKNFVVEHPENSENGDYFTNVALLCSKKISSNSRELAQKITDELNKNLPKEISKIEVAGPGFINFYLDRGFFTESVKNILNKKENWGKNNRLNDKKVMVEYTQPNPFKPFHIGHLMSNAIGESISRIFEFSGAEIVRANYQGDVGLHVAKAIWAILKTKEYLGNKLPTEIIEAANWIGECYSFGAFKYENDDNAKKEIDIINKKVYKKSDEKINKIYDWGRKITLEAFEEIYKILGTKFDKYYFESKMAPIGEKIVIKNIGKVFEESDGAIVFHAQKHDPKLHTRVFMNSQGLPTYDAKEVGLTVTKFKKDNIFSKKLDLSIVTTATEQAEYMKVIHKAISLMHPKLESSMKHITHGMMRLASKNENEGVVSSIKMSSRKGNVITGESLLRDSMNVVYEKVKNRELTEKEKNKISKIVGVAALKYSILKSSLGSDIIYDFEKSISFNGDSGPYLQYTAVRANSILIKARNFILKEKNKEIPNEITNLEKLLYQFEEVVERSYSEFVPHYIATYLTELASAFNTFYANTQILPTSKASVIVDAGGGENPEGKSTSCGTGNKYMGYHLSLVKAFYQTMKNGLWLLGIKIPEKM